MYTAEAIAEKLDFDANSFLLFAVLAGGDYNTECLRGCGTKLARKIVRREFGVAAGTRHVQQAQLLKWRDKLESVLQICGNKIKLPPNFPDFKALGHYRAPNVSTPEQLRNLRRLQHGWDRPIDQAN